MICPICQQTLTNSNRAFRCPTGHVFDVAREGYVNLLILRRKPKILGDSKEMLIARRAFLGAQHYQPLSHAIGQEVAAFIAKSAEGRKTILDIGCGEGYYIGQLAAQLQQRHLPASTEDPTEDIVEYYGTDISKDAAKLAAKRYPQVQFSVADLNRQILMGDGTVDILLDVFAPRNVAEFTRVLAPAGLLLIAIPATDHLIEVRETFNLMDIQSDKRQHILEQFSRSMQPLPTRKVHNTIHLDNASLNNLVRMTPNYWHLSNEVRQALNNVGQFETTISFELLSFQKVTH